MSIDVAVEVCIVFLKRSSWRAFTINLIIITTQKTSLLLLETSGINFRMVLGQNLFERLYPPKNILQIGLCTENEFGLGGKILLRLFEMPFG
jgi:hypothetical protein